MNTISTGMFGSPSSSAQCAVDFEGYHQCFRYLSTFLSIAGQGIAHLKRDRTRVIYDVEDLELWRRRDEFLCMCTKATRNASSYLERLEPGIDRDDMRLHH